MLSKSKGIVLQITRYTDSGIIAHILSQKYGLIALMVKGIHSKKRGHITAYFQPLHILSLEIYYKESRSIQSLKEVSLDRGLNLVPFDYSRNAIAFFVGEVLKKTLNENEPDDEIYNFVTNSIIFLDSAPNINNYHIAFLISLASFLGIEPANTFSDSNIFFDMQNGEYLSSPPLHGFYMDRDFSKLLFNFSKTSLEDCGDIKLSGKLRTQFLEILLTYYSMHLQGLKKIKSLVVLAEVFRT